MSEERGQLSGVREWMASMKVTMLPLAMVGALAGGLLASCGEGDAASTQETSCEVDDDCELGTVCILTRHVCEAVDCSFCLVGQVCYKADDGSETCSKPECTTSSQCQGDKSCSKGLCVEASCTTRDDCPDGQICNQLAGVCINPPSSCTTDFDCPAGEVCKDDGSCAPGCAGDSDCDVSQFCNTESKLCEAGCRTDASCTMEQSCNAETRECECVQSKCAAGLYCDAVTQGCIEKVITSCDDVVCSPGQVCDSATFTCKDKPAACSPLDGQPNSCEPGYQCNQLSGECEIKVCAGISESDCMAPTAFLNTDFCACVQCLEDNHCPAGSGCNSNGQCIQGCMACDEGTPGSCGGATPFCFSGCCVACTTSSDCNAGEVCLQDNSCGAPPDCTQDASICPTGTMCVNGACQTTNPGGGGNCTPGDDTPCFPGMCVPDAANPGSGTCQGGLPGGGGGGTCSVDCTSQGLTCGSGLTGPACTGCTDGFDPKCLSLGLSGLCLLGSCAF